MEGWDRSRSVRSVVRVTPFARSREVAVVSGVSARVIPLRSPFVRSVAVFPSLFAAVNHSRLSRVQRFSVAIPAGGGTLATHGETDGRHVFPNGPRRDRFLDAERTVFLSEPWLMCRLRPNPVSCRVDAWRNSWTQRADSVTDVVT